MKAHVLIEPAIVIHIYTVNMWWGVASGYGWSYLIQLLDHVSRLWAINVWYHNREGWGQLQSAPTPMTNRAIYHCIYLSQHKNMLSVKFLLFMKLPKSNHRSLPLGTTYRSQPSQRNHIWWQTVIHLVIDSLYVSIAADCIKGPAFCNHNHLCHMTIVAIINTHNRNNRFNYVGIVCIIMVMTMTTMKSAELRQIYALVYRWAMSIPNNNTSMSRHYGLELFKPVPL